LGRVKADALDGRPPSVSRMTAPIALKRVSHCSRSSLY
jgi:hypothetical protein